jgi:hypothetical protein
MIRPLIPLNDHKTSLESSPIADLRTCIISAAAGPALGPVVPTVTVTGTAAPFKFTVDGLKLRVIPDGSIVLGKGLSVTVLGVVEVGVTLIMAV